MFQKNSYCFRFTNTTELEGAIGQKIIKYVELRVEPCKEAETTCNTRLLAATDNLRSGNINPKLLLAHEKLQTVRIDTSFVGVVASTANYTQPMFKSVNTNNRIKINLEEEQFRDVHLEPMTVRTRAGWFWQNANNTKTNVTLDCEYLSSTLRMPGVDKTWISPTGSVSEKIPYIVIRYLLSNKTLLVVRDYPLIYWIFVNVGGILEIVSFVFLILILIHREVILE